MNFLLEANGSRGSFLNVGFRKAEEDFSIHCDCPAREWGKFSKHKWQLYNGGEDTLFNLVNHTNLPPLLKSL